MIKKVLPKTALISVSNKSGVLTFAKLLQKNGVKIFATGGTASALKGAGIRVSKVSSISHFPEIFGGRVKTLSPYISGGILGQRDRDKAEAKENNITWIDLVVCNLYPFSDVAKNTNSTMDEKIENIDIGGPTMIRAAAKNFKWVSVVVSPKDYRSVARTVSGGGLTEKKRFDLAKKAFGHCAEYDQTIFETLSGRLVEDVSLRYGENPHQKAFVVRADTGSSVGVPQAKQLQGKELSYNNFLDGDAALQCLSEFEKSPACVIVKHNSPCGVGVGKNIKEAFSMAFDVDSLSAFGGVVALNRKCSVDLAEKIFGHLRDSKVMVIGAGEISRTTAQSLLSRGARSIFVTNRSYERAAELAEDLHGESVRFDQWHDVLQEVDVVISSTGAPHAVMKREHIEAVRRKRRYRPLFVIDIAVPRDVEVEVGEIEEVYLYDIDTLKEIAIVGKGQRADQIKLCESIIDQELTDSGLFGS